MVPPLLSQNLLSLNEDGEKLTLSIRVDLNNETEIQDFTLYESIFKNKLRYSYETFIDDFLNPESQNHNALQLMYEVAKKRKIIRKRE
jgi:exoribonuclease R